MLTETFVALAADEKLVKAAVEGGLMALKCGSNRQQECFSAMQSSDLPNHTKLAVKRGRGLGAVEPDG